MRLVRSGAGSEVRVLFDPTECGGCGASFRRLGTYRPEFSPCGAHLSGHWNLTCRSCGAATWDTTCPAMSTVRNPLEGHDHWSDVQHGPSLDVGD